MSGTRRAGTVRFIKQKAPVHYAGLLRMKGVWRGLRGGLPSTTKQFTRLLVVPTNPISIFGPSNSQRMTVRLSTQRWRTVFGTKRNPPNNKLEVGWNAAFRDAFNGYVAR